MTHSLFQIIVIITILIVAYLVAIRFSPDPLITKIIQIIIFLIAIYIVLFKILPLAGVSF